MGRILEAIFRRILRLLVLIVLLPLLCLAVAYTSPRSYQATATLFALRRYEIISATNQDTNSPATPAQSQTNTLSELLQTRSFALLVASGTNLEAMLNLDPSTKADFQLREDALAGEVSHHVQVTAQGTNLFAITYTGRDPKVAQQVVKSIIQNYAKQSQEFGQSLLNSYRTQFANASHNEDVAVAAETQFIQAHPNLTQTQLLADPQYIQLHSHTVEAQTTVQNLQSAINTINLQVASQGNGADSLFKVIDAAVVPDQPVSRSGQLLMAGVIGLVVALLASALYLSIIVRRDHALYTALDLEKLTFLPVIEQLPHVPPTTVPLLVNESEH